MKFVRFRENVEYENNLFRVVVMKLFSHEVITNNGVKIDNPRQFREDGTVPISTNLSHLFFINRSFSRELYKLSGGFEIESNFNNDEGSDDENFAFMESSYLDLPIKLKLYFEDRSILLSMLLEEYHNIKIPLDLLK